MGSPLGLFNLVDKDNKPVTRSHKVFEGGSKGMGQKVKSLFDNTTVFSPYPLGSIDPQTGTALKIKKWSDIHNDDIYDTSISSIIKYTTQHPGMKLDFMDFAYLRNLGVYPNNRLIVARRFGAAVGNDLTKMGVPPFKTMVSWIPETDDSFLSVQYNEVWDEAEASYTNVLNDLGKSFKLSGDDSNKVGDLLAGGLGIVPFPGLSEPIQRAVMEKFGLVNDAYTLPLGNPNLIRMAKKRSTVSPDEPGSGLACDIEIKMVVEYEQKFINGVDPTLAYMDILQNAIYFGTSDAAFQMGKAFGVGANNLMNDLISGNYNKIYNTLKTIVKTIMTELRKMIEQLVDLLIAPFKDEEDQEDSAEDENAAARSNLTKMLTAFTSISEKAIGSVIGKYKQRLLGITNALTGAPSTPWHITIGNPKKPVFCSGDMLLATVDMEMGKVLAYNDLPSTIKFTLTFKNARPLGAQEIFNRFNTGRGRSVLTVQVQSEASTKPDGTVDTSGGPTKKKVVTKSFAASPNTSENSKLSDYKYGYTEGAGENYFSFKGETQDGNVAENKEPVNMAEAQRTPNGTVQSPAANNTAQLQPSAGSGQAQLPPQPNDSALGPVAAVDPSTPQVYGPQPQLAPQTPLPSTVPPTTTSNTPLTDIEISRASDQTLKARSEKNLQEQGDLLFSSRAQKPNETDAQYETRRQETLDKVNKLQFERRKIESEQSSRLGN